DQPGRLISVSTSVRDARPGWRSAYSDVEGVVIRVGGTATDVRGLAALALPGPHGRVVGGPVLGLVLLRCVHAPVGPLAFTRAPKEVVVPRLNLPALADARRTTGFEGSRQNRLGSLPALDEDPALAVVRTLLPGLPGDALPVAEGGLEDQDRVHDRLVGLLSDRAAVLPVQGVALFHQAGCPVQAKLPALDGGLTDDLPLDFFARVQGERGDGVSEQNVVGVHWRTFLLSRAMPQHAVSRSPLASAPATGRAGLAHCPREGVRGRAGIEPAAPVPGVSQSLPVSALALT